jgi:hypothetical protein
LLLTLGLLGMFGWKQSPAPEVEAPTPRPDVEETPPHHIA